MSGKQASTVTHSLASRQAAQILYRMANSAAAAAAAASSSTTLSITEPITPVLVTAGPTMLQPAPAHFAVTTSGFNQAGGSGGLQQAHNFVPVYFQPMSTGGPQAQLKQDGSMTFQFQPQQYQMLQPPQPQAGGPRTVYQLNIGGPDNGALNPQYQVARMTNAGIVSPSQPAGVKGRAGGRKPANKDDKVTSEENDRRKVRRERNKQAAARCRKRRMDQTNILTEETEGLEEVQSQLKNDIDKYTQDIHEIQFILEAHRAACAKDIPVTAVHSAGLSLAPPRATRASGGVPSVSTTDCDTVIMPPPPVIHIQTVSSSSSSGANSAANMPDPMTGSRGGGSGTSATTTAGRSEETVRKGRPGGLGVSRPASLPVKSDLQQLDLLAMPTPSPSKLVFNFESHSGLTPTGLTPTGLTPLIPSCSADGQEKSDQANTSDASAQSTSPNNLVSL